MDRPGQDRVVLDLGHKRWAIDSGPLESFSVEGLEVLATSEEHTVLSARGEARGLKVGDSLLLVPRHVCPTVNLWEDFSVIGPGGEVEIASSPVDGRNR
jgi:D-serine deaminase-like pyridoxal phosphate-dependent protein